jgi:hypothetical protein
MDGTLNFDRNLSGVSLSDACEIRSTVLTPRQRFSYRRGQNLADDESLMSDGVLRVITGLYRVD